MLTGVFKRSSRPAAATSARRALASIIASRSLRAQRPLRQCAIGPFVVDYVYKEQGLVVELAPRDGVMCERNRARTALLNELGYTVLQISRRELLEQPGRAVGRIRAALR
jgi:very-short-patch-repair endonuclease